MDDDLPDVLAIVGSTTFAAPDGLTIAARIIDAEITERRPDAITSGGAVGVDTLAEEAAVRHGIRFVAHRPTVKRWAGPGGFQERNLRIADTGTRALRISCAESRTYGSGWTVDQMGKAGKPVRRVKVAADGVVDDPGWPVR